MKVIKVVTMGKSFQSSEPLFPICKMGIIMSASQPSKGLCGLCRSKHHFNGLYKPKMEVCEF